MSSSAAEENINKTILMRAIDNWNKGDLDEYLQLYDTQVILHGLCWSSRSGLESVKKFYQRFWAAFPGVQIKQLMI